MLPVYTVYASCRSYPALEKAAEAIRSAKLQYTNVSLVLPSEPKITQNDLSALGRLADLESIDLPPAGEVLIIGSLAARLAGNCTLPTVLAECGLAESHARSYTGKIRSGQPLLALYCDRADSAEKLKTLLQQTGAEEVIAVSQTYSDYGESDKDPHYFRESDILKLGESAKAAGRPLSRASGGFAYE